MSTSEKYDVIIIGAGIIGLFIAYFLAKKDVKVLVLERNEDVGMGISKGHAAVLHVIQLPFGSLKSKLAMLGNKMYDKIKNELNIPIKRVRAFLIVTDYLHYILLPFIYVYLRWKLKDYSEVRLMLSRKSLKKHERNISHKVKGGIIISGYGIIDAFKLIYSLYRFARQNNVKFKFGSEVTNIDIQEDIVTVNVNEIVFKANYVINAAGIDAHKIARQLDDIFTVEYGRGAMLIFNESVSENIIAPLYIKGDSKTKGGGMIPLINNKTIFGPNLSNAVSRYDVFVEKADVSQLIEKFSKYIERKPMTLIKTYAGLRPIEKRHDFVIRYSKKSMKVIHLIGITSPGLTAAPAIADKVIKMLISTGLNLEDKSTIYYEPVRYFKDSLHDIIGEGNDYIICPTCIVSQLDLEKAVKDGATNLQGVMFRTGLGFDECFYTSFIWETIKIIAKAMNTPVEDVTFKGGRSWLVKKS